ncbi:glycosyltransferase [Vibrio aestuarianus]|nr:glycosyltransferase [Vibrio aestuarianus]
MRVYISTISHGHSNIIGKLSCLASLSESFIVVVKSNKAGDSFEELEAKNNFYWINQEFGCGFGRNNNIVFNYCKNKLGMCDDDIFIILNPDVIVTKEEIEALVTNMKHDNVQLATINLFKDTFKTEYDNSVRRFPTIVNFIKSFFGLGNSSILDKSKFLSMGYVDWAAGSFLAFNVKHYTNLLGFDENYFMYCEDIDICYRSKFLGVSVAFYPRLSAVHFAQHNNRRIFSRHFYWHVKSILRFLLSRLGLVTINSCIK